MPVLPRLSFRHGFAVPPPSQREALANPAVWCRGGPACPLAKSCPRSEQWQPRVGRDERRNARFIPPCTAFCRPVAASLTERSPVRADEQKGTSSPELAPSLFSLASKTVSLFSAEKREMGLAPRRRRDLQTRRVWISQTKAHNLTAKRPYCAPTTWLKTSPMGAWRTRPALSS